MKEKRFRALEKLYRWYDDIARSQWSWACTPGCSTCCTASVVVTTLEAAYLWEKGLASIQERVSLGDNADGLPSLTMTTNEQASLCLAKQDFDEEAVLPPTLRCALLENDRCLCYESRPLMCRMMFSSARCDDSGHAQMPFLLVSLNTVCLQIVEDMDSRGWSGYMAHVLPHFVDGASVDACDTGSAMAEDSRLRRNRSNPGFLVPQEDRVQIQSWLRDLDSLLHSK